MTASPPRDRLLLAATLAYASWYSVGALLLLTDLPPAAWRSAAGPWSDCVFLALAATIAFALARRDHGNRRAAVACLGILFISAGAEIFGVTFGFPFGPYMYTDRLGPRLLGMPWIIPCCWMFLVVCALAISSAVLCRDIRHPDEAWTLSCAASAVIVTTFDLLLEPVAVGIKHYWAWLDRESVWYGAPRLNFAGWFALSLLLSAGVSWVLKPHRWSLRTATGAWALLSSVAVLFAGMTWRAGMHRPAWVALNLVGLTAFGLAWVARRPRPLPL